MLLNTIFKILGILAFLAIIVAGISLSYDVFKHKIPFSGESEFRKKYISAQKNAEISVYKWVKTKQKMPPVNEGAFEPAHLILLLKVKNNSNIALALHDLIIDVLNQDGVVIDKCSALSSEIIPRGVDPLSETEVKIVCSNMDLSENENGNLKFIAKFSQI